MVKGRGGVTVRVDFHLIVSLFTLIFLHEELILLDGAMGVVKYRFRITRVNHLAAQRMDASGNQSRHQTLTALNRHLILRAGLADRM